MAQQGGESFRVIDRRRVRPEGEGAPEAEREPAAEPHGTAEPGDTSPAQPAAATHVAGRPEAVVPPPTFATLVQMLALNALEALGAAPGPEGHVRDIPDLPLARHAVDLLAMLDEKCRGNLSEAEGRLLEQTLFDLRMLVVRASSGARP